MDKLRTFEEFNFSKLNPFKKSKPEIQELEETPRYNTTGGNGKNKKNQRLK